MEYNNLSAYLKERYGGRVGKICIDGGFTCPNRDGRCGHGGCIYCGERGAGEHINPRDGIAEQVRAHLADAPSDGRYIAYFQNFTNTYAPVETLSERYSAALTDPRIVALAVGTRPDCIDEEVAELLAGYREKVDVWVELGLQTASDRAAEVFNRGYPTSRFTEAAEILTKWGIPFVVHMMLGLPETDADDAYRTVDLINSSGAFGVKIHSVYVMEGTALAEMYKRGEYSPIGFSDYVTLAADCIARVRPDMIIHRITGDCPRDMLLAPLWSGDKNGVIAAIRESLTSRGLHQGSLYHR